MNLSKRLQCVVGCVQSGGVVADIGCDHGFTAIELVKSGKASGAVAMDIHEGPLSRAREHIKEYGLTGKIDCRLSDGASALMAGEADTILISGMGGALICRILRGSVQVISEAKELVLSPQSEIDLVRHELHNLGFRIAEEQMVFDMGKYYVVIRAVPGKEKYASEEEYIYGRCLIDGASDIFIEYMHRELVRVEGILERIGGKGNLKSRELKGQPEENPAGQKCPGKGKGHSGGRLAALERLKKEQGQIRWVLHKLYN